MTLRPSVEDGFSRNTDVNIGIHSLCILFIGGTCRVDINIVVGVLLTEVKKVSRTLAGEGLGAIRDFRIHTRRGGTGNKVSRRNDGTDIHDVRPKGIRLKVFRTNIVNNINRRGMGREGITIVQARDGEVCVGKKHLEVRNKVGKEVGENGTKGTGIVIKVKTVNSDCRKNVGIRGILYLTITFGTQGVIRENLDKKKDIIQVFIVKV